MYTFIIIAIGFCVYFIFNSDFGLISKYKKLAEYNKRIKGKIEKGEKKIRHYHYRYDGEPYSKKDYKIKEYVGYIIDFILQNLLCNGLSFIAITFLSAAILIFCPMTETSYNFNINSLKDNLVTEGEIHGGMFSMRGYVDGELSYFFSRTFYGKGEKIGHIPANKTYIKYNNEEKPKITVYQEKRVVNDTLSNFIFADLVNEPKTVRYVITVPEGTIETTGTYSIDME